MREQSQNEAGARVQRRFVNEKTVAEFSGISMRTLQQNRLMKRGFPCYKVGKRVLYDIDEVQAVILAGRLQRFTDTHGAEVA